MVGGLELELEGCIDTDVVSSWMVDCSHLISLDIAAQMKSSCFVRDVSRRIAFTGPSCFNAYNVSFFVRLAFLEELSHVP